MMGPSHALSGAAVWLSGSLALDRFADIRQSWLELAVGTAVCAGGALMPDLDLSGRVITGQGGATVAQTFGRLSLFLAEVIEKFSLFVYLLTRTRRDPDRTNGHRTLTHTLIFNIAIGVGTWQLALHYGKWAVLGILFFMTGLALRGLFSRWAVRAGWVIITMVSAAGAYYTWLNLDSARGYPLLGIAAGIGGIVHLLGDVITRHGCPLFWPLPLKRRTWYSIGLPDSMVVQVGGKVETVVLRTVFTVIAVLGAAGLAAPVLLQRFNS